jgi:2',3'-cyclic-nucleotide 2'-phosphodiesterase (5'-nucleotidase family)
MDQRIRPDARVIKRTQSLVQESERALNEPIGELAEKLRVHGQAEEPSDVERLIGAAIAEALLERGAAVDGVFHGLFNDRNIEAGPKTVRDAWNILPFENYIVTAELTPDELRSVMEEVYAGRESRSLIGFNLRTEGHGAERKVAEIMRDNGQPLEQDKKCRIAFNAFDSRSGGHRFMKLRKFLEVPSANCTFHPVLTRDALIAYFQRHKVVHRIAAAVPGESWSDRRSLA